MRMIPYILPVALTLCLASTTHADELAKHRLIILADMGNEPDEEQQMAHMLMYCNEFDVEGLIAVTGKYLHPGRKETYKQKVHPELFHNLVEGYAKVVDNLRQHANGWPTPEHLHSVTQPGQPGYGIADTGSGRASPGSELIVRALLREDPRPIWVVVNAGANTLAQALVDIRAKYPPGKVQGLVAKLRVFENGAQDNAGAWICHEFPDIHWIRSNYQTYCYGGPSGDGRVDNSGSAKELGPYTWEPYAYSNVGQHQWALEHIKGNHGPLGRLWPIRQFSNGRISFLEGGGTIPWLGLVNKGLFDINEPSWGSWSGRFSRQKVANYWSKHKDVRRDEEQVTPFYLYKEEADEWINPEDGEDYSGIFAPVWRWRRAFFNDFACRMDWCTQPHDKANHNPVAAVNGDSNNTIVHLKAAPGSTVTLDASATTDPDQDPVDVRWWQYQEAGTYSGSVQLVGAGGPQVAVHIPDDAKGTQIHVILEASDRNPIASMYDYRRIVIDVK